MTNDTNLPAPIREADDGFGRAAAASPGDRLIVGQLIRCGKGRYLHGDEDADFVGQLVYAGAVARAYQKWHAKKVVEQIIDIEMGDAFPHSLDDVIAADTCASLGEWGLTGAIDCRKEPHGDDYTIVGNLTSRGYAEAFYGLCREVTKKRRVLPGAIPIIRLNKSEFLSPRFGWIDAPHFAIVDWVTRDGQPIGSPDPAAPAAALTPPPPPPRPRRAQPHSAAPSLSVQLDDSIPF